MWATSGGENTPLEKAHKMKYADIYTLISAEEANFKLPVPLTENWEWNMYEHINTTVLYKNSVYKTGKDDDKPFKNITRPILNLQYRAEGLDVKDIVLFINDSYKYFKSFLVKKYHEKWAREVGLDTFIDKLVESYVDFGGVLVKKSKNVMPEVVPMRRIAFCDQTDILSGPICEKHFYSPDQLKEYEKKGWKNIEDVIVLAGQMKVNDTSTGRVAQTPGKYIEVYEVHGVFPKSWLGDEYADDDELVRQLHICTFYHDQEGNKKGIYLYRGPEKELPYKLLLRDEIYGRALGLGGAEELFEPQVWTNYDVIRMKEMLDQASKILYQTSDPAYANRNKTNDLDNGEILITAPNSPIAQINTFPVNLQVFEKSVATWEVHARQMGAAQEAIMGDEPPAGTPFKSVEYQAAESHSLHKYRRGKIATFLDELYREWFIPHIASEITSGDEFLAELDVEELQQVADGLVTCVTNDAIKQLVLQGKYVTLDQLQVLKDVVRENFMKGGKEKFIEILKGELKDAPMSIKVNVAGKQHDLAGKVDKAVNVIKFLLAAGPNAQPYGKQINEILELSGLSPVDFYNIFLTPQAGELPDVASKPLEKLTERPTVTSQVEKQ